MIATVSRYAFRIAVALLTVGILVVGTFLVLVAVPDMTGDVAEGPTAAPSRPPQPLAAVRHGPVARGHRDAGRRQLQWLPHDRHGNRRARSRSR